MPTITFTQRITLDQYEQMFAAGAFDDRPPTEFLDGEQVPKKPQNPPHSVSAEDCGTELARTIPSGWHVRAAKPIRLPPQDSEPDPDRCVVRGHNRDYRTKHPGPLDVAIVVEVSDSSLDQDRGH